MTKKSIFSFYDYKSYLVSVEQSGVHKGFRSRITECIDSQNAFVSQVLNGAVNFSLEQGLKIAEFLRLEEDEHQYFLLMIEYKRAGTVGLKEYFRKLLDSLREKNLIIKERVQIPQVLPVERQAQYYSSWIYAAVHIATMVPRLNSIEKIAQGLNLSNDKVSQAINFLLENGLVEKDGQSLKSGRVQIHLGRDSNNINKHHSNWRIESLKSLDNPNRNDLHYSGVSSLSKDDVEKIKSLFVDMIENYVRLIEKSPEEELYAFNLDFFRMLKN